MYQKTKENPLDIRLKTFSVEMIRAIKTIHQTNLNHNILSQLIRSGTSIGANFQEAQESESRNDFVHKLAISKKESKETMYWLDILLELQPEHSLMLKKLRSEAYEFTKIFAASISTAKSNANQK